MRIYAGYDSGGSKTKCVLADENGVVLADGIDGPSNILLCGRDIAENSIRRCTEKALENAGLSRNNPIYSAYFGTASIETFSKNETTYEFLKCCTGAEHFGMNSDAYIAWYGTTFGESGIISIAGTGAVTVGICKDGRWKKSSGWGCLIGDEGSGYSIGRRAIQLAVKSYDGRCEKNRFERGIMELYSLKSMKDILELIYAQPGKSNKVIASAAKYVFQLFDEGDGLAIEIVEGAASEITDAIYSVYSYLELCGRQIKIGLSGGIFHNNKKFMDMINHKLMKKGMRDYLLMLPKISPEISALILSYRQTGETDYAVAIHRLG